MHEPCQLADHYNSLILIVICFRQTTRMQTPSHTDDSAPSPSRQRRPQSVAPPSGPRQKPGPLRVIEASGNRLELPAEGFAKATDRPDERAGDPDLMRLRRWRWSARSAVEVPDPGEVAPAAARPDAPCPKNDNAPQSGALAEPTADRFDTDGEGRFPRGLRSQAAQDHRSE